MEEWRNIYGYENEYQISNLGNVRRVNGQIIHPSLSSKGYLRVNLYRDGKYRTCFVHKLVLQSFTDSATWLEEVNHKDYDRTNNHLDNLEWITHADNVRYSVVNRPRHYVRKAFTPIKNFRRVEQRTQEGVLVKTWDNLSTIARVTGYHSGIIKKCCEHQPHYKSAHGYVWQYALD